MANEAKADKPKKRPGPFIVWSPDGETPAKVAHDTHGAAFKAAHLMAAKYPGQTFMVMSRAGRTVTNGVAA